MAEWAPTVAEIASLLRARTYAANAEQEGTFTEETRPTAAQVQEIIDLAVDDVQAVFVSDTVPLSAERAARRAASLRAALFVELSYFPEQAEDLSPYLQLRAQAEQAMRTLIASAQARDPFAEAELTS